MNSNVEVVVIGGGYAGVAAANRLARRDDVSVTLINPLPDFVERIRLHQLATGSDDAVEGLDQVLGGNVRLVVDAATRIDATERQVALAGGGTVAYDYLVYAVGSGAAAPGVPGVAEFAHTVSHLDGAHHLRSTLADTPTTAPLTVVGSGPTGLETAAELAELGRTVTLVCGPVFAPSLHPRVRPRVARRFAELGVTVLEGPHASVTEVRRDTVLLADGCELPSAVTVWTAGFRIPDLAGRSGLRTDSEGRLLTDATLTSLDDERIIGAGDAAAMKDRSIRMSCQAAGQLGPGAAATILRRIDGRTPRPVRVLFVGQCISLGRDEGIVQFAHLDDRVTRFRIGGRPAARIKEFICRTTVKQLVSGARKASSRDHSADRVESRA